MSLSAALARVDELLELLERLTKATERIADSLPAIELLLARREAK
jgi:hypothetical protein